MRRLDTRNRIVLTLLGLLLTAAGVYGLARSFGAFGDDQAEARVWNSDAREIVADNDHWLWPVIAVVAVIVALLAARWLWRQLRPYPVVHELSVVESDEGRTTVRAQAATEALDADLESEPSIRSASTRLFSDGEVPHLRMVLEVADDTDVPGLVARVREHAVPRLCQALDLGQVEAHVRVVLAGAPERSVS